MQVFICIGGIAMLRPRIIAAACACCSGVIPAIMPLMSMVIVMSQRPSFTLSAGVCAPSTATRATHIRPETIDFDRERCFIGNSLIRQRRGVGRVVCILHRFLSLAAVVVVGGGLQAAALSAGLKPRGYVRPGSR